MDSWNKNVLTIGITIFSIMLFPLLILLNTGGIKYVDFYFAIPQIFKQITSLSIVNNMLMHLSLVLVTIGSIFISTTFLFKIPISKEKIEELKQQKIQRFIYNNFGFRHKKYWQILLGYFIAILSFSSFVAYDFLSQQGQIQSLTLYQSYIVILPSIGAILLFARIISHFDFKIIDTNIGNFIVLAYVSQFIYTIFSSGKFPFSQIVNMIVYPIPNSQHMLTVYGTVVITTLFITFLDWMFITKIYKKSIADSEKTIKKNSKKNTWFVIFFISSIVVLVIIMNPVYDEEKTLQFRDVKFIQIDEPKNTEQYKQGESFTRYTDLISGYTVEKPWFRWIFNVNVKQFFENAGGKLPSGTTGGLVLENSYESTIITLVQNDSNMPIEDMFEHKLTDLPQRTGLNYTVISKYASDDKGYLELFGQNKYESKYSFETIRKYNGKIYSITINSERPDRVTPYTLQDINFIFNSYKIIP